MSVILQRIDSSPMSSFHLISYHKRYLFRINILWAHTGAISKQLTYRTILYKRKWKTYFLWKQFIWNIFIREKWNWKCNMEEFWTSLEIHCGQFPHQETDIIFLWQAQTSLNIRKVFTVLELNYWIIFLLHSTVSTII